MSRAVVDPYAFGAPPPMIRATITGASQNEVTPHVLVFPEYQAGDVVVFLFRSASSVTLTTPTGWTLVVARSASGDSRVLAREMDGTEGASVDYAGSTARRAAWIGYALGRVAVPTSLGTAEHVAGIDPASRSFAWGDARATLVIAAANGRATDNTLTLPSDYADQRNAETGVAQVTTVHARIATAHRVMQAASENPGAFTQTGTLDTPHALTVAFPLVAG